MPSNTDKSLGLPHILKAAYKAPVLPAPDVPVKDTATPLVEVKSIRVEPKPDSIVKAWSSKLGELRVLAASCHTS